MNCKLAVPCKMQNLKELCKLEADVWLFLNRCKFLLQSTCILHLDNRLVNRSNNLSV